jgi:hypothetical protein
LAGAVEAPASSDATTKGAAKKLEGIAAAEARKDAEPAEAAVAEGRARVVAAVVAKESV